MLPEESSVALDDRHARRLTCGVEDVHFDGLVVDGELTVVQILDGLFVRLEELAVEEHVDYRRFARAAGSEQDETVAGVLIGHVR